MNANLVVWFLIGGVWSDIVGKFSDLHEAKAVAGSLFSKFPAVKAVVVRENDACKLHLVKDHNGHCLVREEA